MKQSVLRSLSAKDTVLVLETKRKNLDSLDEDALVELHARVQRARNKHVKNYRRGAADRVVKTGTRGGARPANQRDRDRAEALEDALARVSRRLATVARQSATALRAERLAAASTAGGAPGGRSGGTGIPGAPGGRSGGPAKGVNRPSDRGADRRPKTPARKKRAASSAAAGARRQARKDSR